MVDSFGKVRTAWLVVMCVVAASLCLLPGAAVTAQQTSEWKVLASGTTQELRTLSFLTDRVGWIAGAGATLLRTTDGGATWTPIPVTGVSAAAEFNKVRFFDQNVGWIGGNGLWRTQNGGTSWTAAPLPTGLTSPAITASATFSSTRAWAIGRGGTNESFLVEYGAASSGNLILTSNATGTLGITGNDLGVLSNLGSRFGVTVGDNGSIQEVRLGFGSNVSARTSGTTQRLNAVYLFDLDNGWAVGEGGTILRTANGGGSWTRQTSNTTANLRGVHFLDANRGAAVGDGGVIVTTRNGGTNWTAEPSSVTTSLRGVFVVNAQTSYAVGANGTLLRKGTVSGPLASVSAASYTTDLSQGAMTAAFGAGLATGTASASTVPLPTTLAGVTVNLKDSQGDARPAPLFFVSAGQINFQVPPETAIGPATITVTNGNTLLASGLVQVGAVAPGLFTANANGQGVPAAVALRVKADGTQTFEPVARLDTATNRFVPLPLDLGPATDQLFVILYGTGWRQRSALTAATLQIGGASAEVSFAGAQGSLVGLDQLNARLPRSLIGRGEVDVVLTVDGKVGNTVRLNVK